MKIVRSFSQNVINSGPGVITIGNFDGLHKGHQKLIEFAHQIAKDNFQMLALVTFSNHPTAVLAPEKEVKQIITQEHKIALLEKMGIDVLYILPFTREFSEQTPEEFLENLSSAFPFSSLILGYDASFGKNKEGTKERVREIAAEKHFNLQYVDPLLVNNKPISSRDIRQLIESGKFEEASDLLGRPYSIYGHVLKGHSKGKTLGFPTANIEVRGLCLPPTGVYSVDVVIDGKKHLAIANLGIAPTLKKESHPVLEVHLINETMSLYDKHIEVIFKQFIRPEMVFNNVDELRAQIQQDISNVIRANIL